MVITAASSLSLGASKGQSHHVDGSSCSTSYGVASNRFGFSFESFRSPDLSHMRSRTPLSKPTPFRWSSGDNDLCLWRASADYSDSVPDSSNFTTYRGYHPLEEVEASKSFRKTQLTSAETARTTIEISEMEYERKMDYPSNGVSVVGCLHPVFGEEESYVRDLFCCEDTDYNNLDWKDTENLASSSKSSGSCSAATFYRLDFGRIELFLVHGAQTTISLQDFQDAEPDALLHSTRAILEHINEGGGRCNVALKALCEKKGLYTERAHLIAVDSFGVDVRIFSGVEVRTHRFPFKARAMTKVAAEKQIQQLLFPRARPKKFRTQSNALKESKAF